MLATKSPREGTSAFARSIRMSYELLPSFSVQSSSSSACWTAIRRVSGFWVARFTAVICTSGEVFESGEMRGS